MTINTALGAVRDRYTIADIETQNIHAAGICRKAKKENLEPEQIAIFYRGVMNAVSLHTGSSNPL
jgi:hypothetical protein